MPMEKTATSTKRVSGRPRAFDRNEALRVALELFWQQGFEGTSTSQLTAAMGISPPSLYAAFGSKETLYREVVALYGSRFGGFLTEPLGADGEARQAVEQVLLRAARQFSEADHPSGCMVANGEMQSSPNGSVLAAEVAALRRAAQRQIAIRLESARKTGELPPATDTATLAAFYAMVIQGMAVQAHDGAKPTLLRRMAALAMRAWP